MAAPWVLQDKVWVGSFEEAAPALGDDATLWREREPKRAWLAVYCHEEAPERCLKVRCLSFGSTGSAQRAFEAWRLVGAKPFKYGDAGCWTEIGVLFRWGRLVFEIFGTDASWGSELQSAMLATLIAKRMPAGLPENPH